MRIFPNVKTWLWGSTNAELTELEGLDMWDKDRLDEAGINYVGELGTSDFLDVVDAGQRDKLAALAMRGNSKSDTDRSVPNADTFDVLVSALQHDPNIKYIETYRRQAQLGSNFPAGWPTPPVSAKGAVAAVAAGVQTPA